MLMDTIKSHKDLVVWQKSIALASAAYRATRLLPPEDFGLGSELRRAAAAIATRIAEGSARRTTTQFVQSLHLARGSLSELETQAMIAIDQGYLDSDTDLPSRITEVGRLIDALIRALNSAKQSAHARACSVHHMRAARP
jgi:four helix bundle protein